MKLNNELFDIADAMAGELDSLCQDARESGSTMSKIEDLLENWDKIRNTCLLQVAARQITLKPTPPLHEILGLEIVAGVKRIVPRSEITLHKGEIYYQRKAVA